MANLDIINSTINKGTDALTLGASVSDKFSKIGTKFGKVVHPEPNKASPDRDTGIRPIGDFIAAIKNVGLARQNHYTFTFIPPPLAAIGGSARVNSRLLQLLCSACILPGVNIDTVQTRTFGEAYQTPNDKTYGQVTSTFYVDGHFHVKKLFDNWAEAIMDPVSRTFNFYDEYITDISIIIFDNYGLPHYEVVLEQAYPKSINDIQLASDNHDFMKVDVTWAYRKWSSRLIDNSLHEKEGQVNTERTPTIHERLMGYVGDFKDYQQRFNNLNGDVNRAADMIKNKDWGGYVGQNFGGASF